MLEYGAGNGEECPEEAVERDKYSYVLGCSRKGMCEADDKVRAPTSAGGE